MDGKTIFDDWNTIQARALELGRSIVRLSERAKRELGPDHQLTRKAVHVARVLKPMVSAWNLAALQNFLSRS